MFCGYGYKIETAKCVWALGPHGPQSPLALRDRPQGSVTLAPLGPPMGPMPFGPLGPLGLRPFGPLDLRPFGP